MIRHFSLLTGLFFLLALVSCQKETSFEVPVQAQGSLQNDNGDCLPKFVNGDYIAGQSLGDSNYIDLVIDVSAPGAYTITTDTINGYYFKGTGNASTIGSLNVRLQGFGTPVNQGADPFIVYFDSSFCALEVTVGAGGSSSGTSVYTLDCSGSGFGGTYTAGTAVGASNVLNLNVNVTTPGTWSITTPSVNGTTFSGSGTFTATGPQTITLAGSGTPVNAGTVNLDMTINGSTCSFGMTVGGSTNPVPAGTYFPMTNGSWWSYDTDAGDTTKTTVNGTTTLIGRTWSRFVTTDDFGGSDEAYFRKDNATNFYYTYVDASQFGAFGITFSAAGLDMLFLKESLTNTSTWNSDHTGTMAGQPVTVRFNFTTVDANATVTVGGNTFTNVYHVRMVIRLGVAGVFQDFSPAADMYYAKGVGLIRAVEGGTEIQAIRHWQVL